MMSRPRLPATHHVAGYCNKSSLDGDWPTTKSFRVDSDGVSVNHLERFDADDPAAAMLGLQNWKLGQPNFQTRASGRFAVLPVGDIVECTGAAVIADPIEHPEHPDPSHALIQRSPGDGDDERAFKTCLLQAVQSVHPALPPE